ncbi:dipeptidyl aminopeptidase/acylaminoacyl peptidase [Novosphingobium hassiacum]|uniref:Dipeptidyl aminopeptidase/acylaminoacyl peptidase n=1 Tax=Novosphingobium hassiacum TaxID=173676 RepID=A0A7W6EX19_9SPHN|nr:S9 family peptidase [Novosphingobium hassiacum]MBB3861962.1 dipeptidyl aminopeptidase/acylaminoacyl peptidase [Novosphingobium hassiacum]
MVATAIIAAPAFAAEPPPLSLYGSLPGVERAAMSASGARVALIGRVGEKRTLVLLDEAKKPLRAVDLGDAKVRGLYWAGDDRVLLYKSDTTNLGAGFTTDRAELFTMLVIPVGQEKPWIVFDHNERITGGVQGFYGIQQREGRYYGYFGGITLEGDFRSTPYLRTTDPMLYEVDLVTGKTLEIARRYEGEGFRDWLIGNDGKVRAWLDFEARSGKWEVQNAKGQRIAQGVNRLGQVSLVGLGGTPGTVILAEEPEGQDGRWTEIPESGGEAKEIMVGTNVDHAYFDENSRQFIGWREEADRPAYHFSDAFRQKVANATVKAFPGLSVHIQGWNDAFDKLLVMTEGVGDPQTWWRVNIRTGAAGELGVSYPMDAGSVGPMQMVNYKAGDGLDIAAVLTLPPGREAKNLPVIVMPHGGPTARDYPGFDWWVQALASRGYAVLQPNFRGSDGYGVAFRRAGNREWGRKMQSDISDGLAWLAAQGIADPKRACIVGASYGGYAALAGVTLQQGLYRCAVAVAGVSDVAKLVATDLRASAYDKTMKAALAEEIGAKTDLKAISPVAFAARADAPVMLIHGKDDLRVPFEQSKAMDAALRAAGKPVELVVLPGEDHYLSRSATRLAMLEALVRFVTAHNPPDAGR